MMNVRLVLCNLHKVFAVVSISCYINGIQFNFDLSCYPDSFGNCF